MPKLFPDHFARRFIKRPKYRHKLCTYRLEWFRRNSLPLNQRVEPHLVIHVSGLQLGDGGEGREFDAVVEISGFQRVDVPAETPMAVVRKGSAVGHGERKLAVGGGLDAVTLLMHQPMMPATQQNQVVDRRLPAIGPLLPLVEFAEHDEELVFAGIEVGAELADFPAERGEEIGLRSKRRPVARSICLSV